MVLSYNYLEAKTEKLLQRKLVELQVKSGYTVKIINIYASGKKVIAWYYANPKDALNVK